MKWIELTLRDGRKTAVLRERITSVTEYPCNGENRALIEVLGRTWGIQTGETYEEVIKRVTDIQRADDCIVIRGQTEMRI